MKLSVTFPPPLRIVKTILSPAGSAVQAVPLSVVAGYLEDLLPSPGVGPTAAKLFPGTVDSSGQVSTNLHQPNAVSLVMASGTPTTTLCRVRWDGVATSALGQLIPIESTSGYSSITLYTETPLPLQTLSVIASAGTPTLNVTFFWME